MQLFLIYLFLFITGSFAGWIIEVIFRRLFTVKKWVNPGFMKGPCLPLYGFGVILMFSVCFLCIYLFPESIQLYNPFGGLFGRLEKSGPTWFDIIPIVLMAISMILLEFVAGLIFIKGFHIKLWDYTNMKGNILGIICPVFSAIWLLVAILFYYVIDPVLYYLSTIVHEFMFGDNGDVANVGLIFLLGISYGIFIYDFISSIGLFNAVSNFAKEAGVVDKYESLMEGLSEKVASGKHSLFLKLPKKIQNTVINRKNNQEPSRVKEKIAEIVYIDPEKEKDKSANYDENGRPIKMDDKTNKKN